MRIPLLAVVLAVALVLTACGDGEDKGISVVPAAGADTPPDTASVASYAVTGNEWLKLSKDERLKAATDFVADNPDECANADDRSADAGLVLDFTDTSIGTDFPLNVPISELLAEGCAAALQSGDDGLAPEGPQAP